MGILKKRSRMLKLIFAAVAVAVAVFAYRKTTAEKIEYVKYTENDLPDQKGRTFLITGGNIGLGLGTAQLLRRANANVIISARNEAKGENAVATIVKEPGTGEVRFEILDLSDLESVAAFSNGILEKEKDIVLVLNAGVMGVDKSTTKQGFEMTIGVNHLAHFVLFKRLASIVKRVVSVSSLGASFAPASAATSWEDWVYHLDDSWSDFFYSSYKYVRYGVSKAANVAFVEGVKAHYPNIEAVAVQPGYTRTNLQTGTAFSFLNGFSSMSMTPIEGALIQTRAATEATLNLTRTQWFAPSDQTVGFPAIVDNEFPAIFSTKETALNLWQASEKLTKEYL